MNGFIDVWYGNILSQEVDKSRLSDCLCHEEAKHAETIKNKQFQKNYISTRMTVRQTLATYLDMPAKDIVMVRSKYGKPALANGALFFNISHSGDKLMIAVSDMGELGVDIEQCRPMRRLAGLAAKCFAVEELDYWKQLPEALQQTQFYKLWTSKEAFVKATGRGIALGLKHCVINLDNPLNFKKVPADYGEARHWRILPVDELERYCAAVVMHSLDREISLNLYAFS